MSTKGHKLSAATKENMSRIAKDREDRRHAQLELSIEGNRIFIRALGNNAVSVKIDVTPLWHFFKGALAYKATRSTTESNLPTNDKGVL